MKPTSARIIGAAALALLMSACGQPGPLYLPKPPAKHAPAAPSAPPSSAVVTP